MTPNPDSLPVVVHAPGHAYSRSEAHDVAAYLRSIPNLAPQALPLLPLGATSASRRCIVSASLPPLGAPTK